MAERNWKETILPAYEVRKTREQKTAFIRLLEEAYGDRLHVEEAKGGLKSRNIMIGDPEKAKRVYTAHYDTCARLPFPNFITPLNIPVYILYNIVLTLVLIVPIFLLTVLAAKLLRPLGEFTSFLGSEVTLIGLAIAEIALLMAGPANPHTANDNTSGVVTVLTLADRLDPEENAFILFDHEEVGLLGSSAYAKAHPVVRKSTLIVNFDCVSDGDYLLFVCSDPASDAKAMLSERAQTVLGSRGKTAVVMGKKGVFYPSDQAAFRKTVAVAALKKGAVGLYMDRIHTKRDTAFDDGNIASLAELFAAWE